MSSQPSPARWCFSEVAPGLVVGSNGPTGAQNDSAQPPAIHNTVSKPAANNALYDAQGEPLSAEASTQVSTWRSHHAFSARCEHVAVYQDGDTCCVEHGADASTWQRTMASWREHYRSWEASFRLSALSADAQPNILLSVAPFYFPPVVPEVHTEAPPAGTSPLSTLAPLMASREDQQRYNARLLQTPLIWEEPQVVSLECSARGLFLWSEQWSQFGLRLADRCLVPRGPGEATAHVSTTNTAAASSAAAAGSTDSPAATWYDAAVQLRWNMEAPTQTRAEREQFSRAVLTVALGTKSMDTSSQEMTWDTVATHEVSVSPLASNAVFLPHVTLMEKHDSVTVL